jgi:1-acyl-sn-glycerol-3-phosphate acyltransferase
MKLKSLPGAYRLTVLWGRWTRLYQRVSIVGLEHVPLDGPLLIVSNHLSYFDPLLISAFFPRIIYWMAKPELFKHPFLRKVLINNYVFPAARGEKSDIFLKGVSGKIQKGQAVGIFIQGGIVKPGETKVAKKRSGHRSHTKRLPCFIGSNQRNARAVFVESVNSETGEIERQNKASFQPAPRSNE